MQVTIVMFLDRRIVADGTPVTSEHLNLYSYEV